MRRAAALAGLALAGCGSAAHQPAALAPTPAPRSFTIVHSRPDITVPRGRHLVAAIQRRTRLFARPGGRVLARLRPRTEFGSQTVLGVLHRRAGWLKVAVSQLPNGHRGWIHTRDAALAGTDYDIHVDRSAHRAVLRRDGRVVLRFPVAVGRPGNETPLGRYAVTDKLTPVESTSPYGCCALALTGHQTELEPGWPGGDRLAIHGTPSTASIGQAVSLGCMRASAAALHKLMRRVPLGAPVVIRA
jgi:lipoprotein-anchoring transpeptidase ErfK/SrfK